MSLELFYIFNAPSSLTFSPLSSMFNFFGGNSKPARRNSVTDSTDSIGSASSGAQPKQFRPTDAVGVDRLLYGHDTQGKSAQWKDSNHEPVKGGLTPANATAGGISISGGEAPIVKTDSFVIKQKQQQPAKVMDLEPVEFASYQLDDWAMSKGGHQ